MKSVVFIGNRFGVLNECFLEKTWLLKNIFALTGSHLEGELKLRRYEFDQFSFSDKNQIIQKLKEIEWDILVSNGCPFLLPINELSHPSKLLINVHPAILPEFKGPHAINGVILNQSSVLGATAHYMEEQADVGNIIAQVRKPLTDDLDAGLVYRLSFQCEAEAMRDAIQKLKSANYAYSGLSQDPKSGTFYKRKSRDLEVNFEIDSCESILRKVRAFGIASLGVKATTTEGTIKIFDADQIENAAAIKMLSKGRPGTTILSYDNKMVVEAADGLIRIKSFEFLKPELR